MMIFVDVCSYLYYYDFFCFLNLIKKYVSVVILGGRGLSNFVLVVF